jgi:hypothetical protein
MLQEDTNMKPAEESRLTFHSAADRILSRCQFKGIPAGPQVSVFQVDPTTGDRLNLVATAVVRHGGWVDLSEPDDLSYSGRKLLVHALGMVGILTMAGFFCGLAQSGENPFVLAGCCGAIGGLVVLLGYGPIALLIAAIGAVVDWKTTHRKPSWWEKSGPTRISPLMPLGRRSPG